MFPRLRITYGVGASMAVAVLTLAGCGATARPQAEAPDIATPDEGVVSLRAGVNDPNDLTLSVTEYLPESITVAVGTRVRWQVDGPEPHTVTFFPEGEQRPPPDDHSVVEPLPAQGPYQGTTKVNSGTLPIGPEGPRPRTFDLTFGAPGTYPYFCALHPRMTGVVAVVPDPSNAESQEQIATRGEEELQRWLGEGRAGKQKLLSAEPHLTTGPEGTRTWTVEMGAATEHADLLAFAPTPLDARPGDRIRFVNNSQAPHTATFAGTGQFPTNPFTPEVLEARPGPSPQTLNPSDYFNTGWLPPDFPAGAGPPLEARSFTFVVPHAATYGYVCFLHVASGMSGMLRVRS